MTKYTLGARELGHTTPSDFLQIMSIIQGRSIISVGDWGDERFELGLSGNLMVRFLRTDEGMTVNLFSTKNLGENPTLVIDMGDMEKRVPISVIERKLWGLRTLYAIFYLIDHGREKELESYIIQHPYGDIEAALLKEDEQLYIESISYGSWVLAVWAKTQKAYKSIISVAGLAFERGREAFLGKLEADTRLKNAEADLKEIAVSEGRFEMSKKQFDYLIKATEKLDVPEAKELLKKKIIEATKSFTMGDKSNDQSYRQLEDYGPVM